MIRQTETNQPNLNRLDRYTPQLRITSLMSKVFAYEFGLLPQYIEALYANLRIAVVHGGDKDKDGSVIYKTHNPRAWKSYKEVAQDIQSALMEIGFQHVFVLPDDMNLPETLKKENIHLVWLNTGGVQGYNPVCHAPSMLEMLGIPYLGHDPFCAAMLDSKPAFKRELHSLGIDSAPFMTWHPSQGILGLSKNSRFGITFGDHEGAFVVKPVSGRASLHVEVVESAQDLPRVAEQIYRITRNTVLIEKFLGGREFCVAVSGGVVYTGDEFFKLNTPFAFSTAERLFDKDEKIFTSMDKKAITLDRVRTLAPHETELKKKLIELAQSIYWDLNLQSLIRVDVREDLNGNLHVLEANPKPDLKKPTSAQTSLVFVGLNEYGMSYNDLILSLLADRLDYLFTYNTGMIQPIIDFLV